MNSVATPVYLDYNATTPLLEEVQSAICGALQLWGNPSSSYTKGKNARAAVEGARQQVASLVRSLPEEVIFMSGGTEANNQVILTAVEVFSRSLTDEARSRGVKPHIVTTTIEHDAIVKPLEHLETKALITVTYVAPESETGAVSAEKVAAACTTNTCLVSVMLANNETGVLQPVCDISRRIRALNKNILLHTDSAQALGKIPVDINELGVDYLTVVGHKFYGPRIGALVRKTTAPLHPMLYGGGQEKGLRPGTENTPMIVGLGKAAEIARQNEAEIEAHLSRLRDRLESLLKERLGDDEVTIHFEGSPRLPNTSSVSFPNLTASSFELLAKCSNNFEASTGAACHSDKVSPSKILSACGVPEEKAKRTVRFSVGRMTQIAEIELVVETVSAMM